MALPSSGQLSLSQVNTELGLTATTAISLGQTNVRALFGVSSGAVSISNGWGKAVGAIAFDTGVRSSNVVYSLPKTLSVSCTFNITSNNGYVYQVNSASYYNMYVNGTYINGLTTITIPAGVSTLSMTFVLVQPNKNTKPTTPSIRVWGTAR